jgi:predicted aldo/keto reductase-like oxidoreductase
MGDVEAVCRKGGALEALERARAEGLVRFVGLSGHTDPDVLAAAMRRFQFDCVLMAVNAADPHHLPFQRELLPLAVEQELGIIGMKIPARGRLLRDDGVRSMKDAMRYVLSLPVSTVIVGITKLDELEENVRIAREFAPLAAKDMQALEALAKPYAEDAMFFKARA